MLTFKRTRNRVAPGGSSGTPGAASGRRASDSGAPRGRPSGRTKKARRQRKSLTDADDESVDTLAYMSSRRLPPVKPASHADLHRRVDSTGQLVAAKAFPSPKKDKQSVRTVQSYDTESVRKSSKFRVSGGRDSGQIMNLADRAARTSDNSSQGRGRHKRTASSNVRLCAVCTHSTAEHYNMPCMHRSLCQECYSEALEEGNVVLCPICMEEVEDFVPMDAEQNREVFMSKADWKEIRNASTFMRSIDDQWDELLHEDSGEYLYYNTELDKTQWDHPTGGVKGEGNMLEDAQESIHKYAYEKLGPDYLGQKWVPPTVDQAKAAHHASVFGHGRAPICTTTIGDMAPMGIGVTLYFRFLKYMVGIFAVMTLISVPAMLVFRQGTRMPRLVLDPVGVSQLSLGNAGDPLRSVYVQDPESTSVFATNATVTTDVLGFGFTSVGASYLVSFCDFIYTWLFVAGLAWLRLRVRKVIKDTNNKVVRASDYTVYIKSGLPAFATEQEVRDHFSDRFGLHVTDKHKSTRDLNDAAHVQPRRRRSRSGVSGVYDGDRVTAKPRRVSQLQTQGSESAPMSPNAPQPIKGVSIASLIDSDRMFADKKTLLAYAEPSPDEAAPNSVWKSGNEAKAMLLPVTNSDHNKKPMYIGSWVADVNLVRPNGDTIRTYLNIHNHMQKLRRARARVNRYAPDTVHKSGPDSVKFAKALERVQAMEKAIMDVRTRLDVREAEEGVQNKCQGQAFVTFNHEESFLRCLDAYSGSTSWIRRLFQSSHLRFDGYYDIQVIQAPDPSDILWENLASSRCDRFGRRMVTALITFLLILFSFVMVLSSSYSQNQFMSLMPEHELCSVGLPETYLGSIDALRTAVEASTTGSVQFHRPDDADKPGLDATCGDLGRYMTFESSAGVTFDVSACSPTTRTVDLPGGANSTVIPSVCPDPTRSTQCPCVNSDMETQEHTCHTLPCFDTSAAGECTSFQPHSLVGCYCLERLRLAMAEDGMLGGASNFFADEGEMCGDWSANLIGAQALTVFAALTLAAINTVLKEVLHSLVSYERHHSATHESEAAAYKLFIAQFINTGLVVLIVSGKLPNGNTFPIEGVGILEGKHSDFTSEWYSSVGVTLTIAMCMTMITPYGIVIGNMCCIKPCQRCRAKYGYYLTQHDANRGFIGAPFNLALRYAQALMVVFVTMLYCGGLPVLMPLACATLGLRFWVDRFLLLRFHPRPPNYGPQLFIMALSLLPWAVVLHLAFSIWMYGNNDILESNVINPSIIEGWTGNNANASQALYDAWFNAAVENDGVGIVQKVVRINVFPHLLFLGFMVATMLLWKLFGGVLKSLWNRCTNADHHVNTRPRKAIAPYSAVYAKLMTHEHKRKAHKNRSCFSKVKGKQWAMSGTAGARSSDQPYRDSDDEDGGTGTGTGKPRHEVSQSSTGAATPATAADTPKLGERGRSHSDAGSASITVKVEHPGDETKADPVASNDAGTVDGGAGDGAGAGAIAGTGVAGEHVEYAGDTKAQDEHATPHSAYASEHSAYASEHSGHDGYEDGAGYGEGYDHTAYGEGYDEAHYAEGYDASAAAHLPSDSYDSNGYRIGGPSPVPTAGDDESTTANPTADTGAGAGAGQTMPGAANPSGKLLDKPPRPRVHDRTRHSLTHNLESSGVKLPHVDTKADHTIVSLDTPPTLPDPTAKLRVFGTKREVVLSSHYLSKRQISQGWRVHERGPVAVLQKQHLSGHAAKGKKLGPPKLKKSWEVIADAGDATYNMLSAKKYRDAMAAQEEQAWVYRPSRRRSDTPLSTSGKTTSPSPKHRRPSPHGHARGGSGLSSDAQDLLSRVTGGGRPSPKARGRSPAGRRRSAASPHSGRRKSAATQQSPYGRRRSGAGRRGSRFRS